MSLPSTKHVGYQYARLTSFQYNSSRFIFASIPFPARTETSFSWTIDFHNSLKTGIETNRAQNIPDMEVVCSADPFSLNTFAYLWSPLVYESLQMRPSACPLRFAFGKSLKTAVMICIASPASKWSGETTMDRYGSN